MYSLLWVSLAHAAAVADVPPGESLVDLVVCPTDAPCGETVYRVSQLATEEALPVLPLDVLLELDGGEWEDGDRISARFEAAMDRARTAWDANRPDDVGRALDDAEAALRKWSGTADNQRLFDLAYLRGAVALAHGEDPASDFRQAAAVAWNRTVTLPVADPTAKAWYETLAQVVQEGTGTLRLAAPPSGATWYLDGVPLAAGPSEVQVFPGVHRVTAHNDGMIRTWKRDVPVLAHHTKEVSAAFSPADDANWVRAQVRDAFGTARLPREVMELVSAWGTRKNVSRVRFVSLDDAGRLRIFTYDIALRRVGPG